MLFWLFGIVHMLVFKDFVLDCDCFIAQICANSGAHAHLIYVIVIIRI